MSLNFEQFLNLYDITFLLIVIISFIFGLKNGFIKSLLNLLKWIIIFYLIKNCFNVLRPIIDPYIANHTISDILIFFSTLIISYLLLTFINRIVIGVIQPRKSGIADISFGGILGIFRGYIVFALLIFFLSNNLQLKSYPLLFENGSFQKTVNYGVDLLKQMPREIDKMKNL